ncbi:helix-turn-helix transcriptional regulator [Azospirillum sp.]|uniref:helix-turn-helix domain-containing protein n=1 Tax=Azospirillum sp. TaxID=34012 RepID=UPI002D256241|nr:helix-turn-helix transcriptional regulator [Azospirillum sp.]HYD67007.1 helix-turn-helix transcriptional regulator [Azospirillum sp.]
MAAAVESEGARTIGSWLRAWRKAAGLRQEDLAAEIDVKQASISRWEKDVVQPNVEDLNRLYALFKGKGLSVAPPPVVNGADREEAPLLGAIRQGGVVRRGAADQERVAARQAPDDRPLVAYRIDTDALTPFGNGWLVLAHDHKAGSNPAECRDKLCVAADERHGTVLGWLRAVRGGYVLERINASTIPLDSLLWVEKVVEIRPT